MAQFVNGSGKSRVSYRISIESHECPVSAITPESMELVELVGSARVAHTVGGVMYGADAAEWPCRFFDAVEAAREIDLEREDRFRESADRQ